MKQHFQKEDARGDLDAATAVTRTPSVSSRAISMQASPLRKLAAAASARAAAGIKVYRLNIGQPDLPTPPAVFEAVRSFSQPTLAYAPSNGLPIPLTAWKSYYRQNGIEIDESEMVITAGGSEAIVFAMSAVCDPDDEIIVFEPFYTNYNGFATLASVNLRPVPLSIENGFHLPPADEIERHITPRTRAILLCNPANPTGTIYTRGEIEGIVEIVGRRGLFLLSDEVYREFAFDAPAISVMSFPEIRDRAVLLDSCSKRFNVCGARIGVLASHNAEVVQTALKFGMARLSVATLEQLALVPLLESPARYTAPIVEEFRKRRDLVYEELRSIPGATFYRPEGAFYIVIGLPVRDSEHFARWLVEEFEHEKETVLLAPAQGFYATPGKGLNEVRIAFTLKGEDLRRSLSLIRLALEAYSKKS
ncbi:MAG: aspartate aminotransferase [Ignavibacteriales bacterium CG07_land_8_20_14_0_80_59_12]|nr:MAG: aspartate aminotransferase [Ignavibacteriales bacterium CG07_land_8_20_14_0_80_59_12]